MTKENAAQFLPLVQALADGKTIQYNDNGEWNDMEGYVAFGNLPSHYRIKPEPEPVKVWITRHADGLICSVTNSDMSEHGWKPATAIITEE